MATVKTCACGRCYTAADWAALVLLGVMRLAGEVLELRNCVCGSTLAIEQEDDMRTYRIENRTSGAHLGDYTAEDKAAAREMAHRDAGYASSAEAAAAIDVTVDMLNADLLVIEIEPEAV